MRIRRGVPRLASLVKMNYYIPEYSPLFYQLYDDLLFNPPAFQPIANGHVLYVYVFLSLI